MLLHLHQPSPPLGRFVELVTYHADYWPAHTMQTLLPDGAVESIVALTDTPRADPPAGLDLRYAASGS